MMLTRAVWHGDAASVYALIAAIDNNCDCQRNSNGVLLRQCGAHVMMTDQRWLDHLLYLRWLYEARRAGRRLS